MDPDRDLAASLPPLSAFHRICFALLVGLLLVAGVALRFFHLGEKPYWYDEVCTSIRLSGHGRDIQGQVPVGEFDLEELRSWAVSVPKANWIDTWRSLGKDNAHQTPLYYMLAQSWVKCWGGSVAVRRSFSAWVSLLAFPLLYWLCLELWGSHRIAGLAIGFLAVSPIHVLYAQEARCYALWVVMTLASSAALLRALRVQDRMSWAFYAVTITLGLYTHLFFGLVVLAHAACMVKESGWSVRRPLQWRFSGPLAAYLTATVPAVILFSPWLLNVVQGYAQIHACTEWARKPTPWSMRFQGWRHGCSSLVVDVAREVEPWHARWVAQVAVILLVGCAVTHLWRQSPSRARTLLLCLIAVPFAGLLLPDLIEGGARSTVPR